jgi:sulfotransferase family protein
MLPNFLIIGAAKSGTTSLYHYLRSHPQVFMPQVKEVTFFTDRHWNNGVEWYEKHFEGAERAAAVGEASPAYTMYPVHRDIPARIAQILPTVRLIYLLRDPIERMRSHYIDHVAHGLNEGPIEKALVTYPIYLNTSRYATQIELFLNHFSRERLLILTSEQLRFAREQTLQRIFAFIGVDPHPITAAMQQEFNRTADKAVRRQLLRAADRLPLYRAMTKFVPGPFKTLVRPLTNRKLSRVRATIPKDLRSWLVDALRDDVRRLYRYLDDSFDGWGIEPNPGAGRRH